MAIFTIDESAVKRIKEMLPADCVGFRIKIRGGGCSGLLYHFEFEKEVKTGDKIFEKDGAKIIIDPKSLLYLANAMLYFSTNLNDSGFKLGNPNVKSSCGCGVSFTIKSNDEKGGDA